MQKLLNSLIRKDYYTLKRARKMGRVLKKLLLGLQEKY